MIKKIRFASHTYDPQTVRYRPYSNDSQTRPVRDLEFDTERLTGLSRWLVENLPAAAFGMHKHFKQADRTVLFLGLNYYQFEKLKIAKAIFNNHNGGYVVNNVGYGSAVKAFAMIEKLDHFYNIKTDMVKIDDYLYDIIEPNVDIYQFIKLQCTRILLTGAVRIELNNQVWNITSSDYVEFGIAL